MILHGLTAATLPGGQGVIFFRASGENGGGAELWRSDGTEAGTYMVKDIRTTGP